MTRARAIAVPGVVLAVMLTLAACGGGTPVPTTQITAPDATRLVLAANPRFAGIGPRDPELVGQAAWYERTTTADGWQVLVRIGWGDCLAGCIEEHRWTYAVGRDGLVTLLREEGDPLVPTSGIAGIITSGPVCPVERDPPDPACAERPVAGAALVVRVPDGAEVARLTTDADGRFSADLAPGSYLVEPQPVAGLPGTPPSQSIEVTGSGSMQTLRFSYDTGIR